MAVLCAWLDRLGDQRSFPATFSAESNQPHMTFSLTSRVSPSDVTNRPHRWVVFAGAWLLFSLLAASWSLATPISASPDEPAHIVKAASVVRGQFVGEPSPLGHVVQVPRYIASTQAETCFAFEPTISADCAVPLPGRSGEIIDGTTTAGLYNPVYYLIVGAPSLAFDNVSGVYAMRIMSGVLSGLFVALAFMLVYTWRRNSLPLAAIAVGTPPMMLFLSGSVNPNSLEIAASLTVFTGMLTIALQPNSRLLTERSMIVLAGAVLAVNARGLSPLWLAVAALAPLIALNWTQIRSLFVKPAVIVTVIGTALATAFALAWMYGSSSLTAAIDDADNFQQYPGVGSSFLAGFNYVIRGTFGFAQTMIGNFGWLDTPAPISVYFLWSAFTGACLIAAFTVLHGRRLVLASVLAGTMVLAPALIQGIYVNGGGLIWQGRYALPLFAFLVVGLFALVSEQIGNIPISMIRRLTFVIWFLWAAAQFVSYATALRRYAVGSDGTWRDLISAADWNAPGGNLLWLSIFAVLLAVAGASAWLVAGAHRSHRTAREPRIGVSAKS